jgi:hypothetical protein
MTPADDRSVITSDLETDEGLETFLRGLEAHHPIPESLRYPETDEDYDRMIEEAQASGYIPLEEVETWLRSLETDTPLPRPRAR